MKGRLTALFLSFWVLAACTGTAQAASGLAAVLGRGGVDVTFQAA